MKKRAQVQRPRSGTVLITRHHCPKSGWWSPVMTGGGVPLHHRRQPNARSWRTPGHVDRGRWPRVPGPGKP